MKKHPLSSSGKGSRYRDVDKDKFNENFDRIFGKPKRSKHCLNPKAKDCDCPACGGYND